MSWCFYNPTEVPQGKTLFDEDNYPQTEYKQDSSLKPVTSDVRQWLRTDVVKRFLQEDYTVKKHNHTRDYTGRSRRLHGTSDK